MDQSKIGSKKWINELIYGKYQDATSDDYANLDDNGSENADDDAFENESNLSSSSSSSSLINEANGDQQSEDDGFQRVDPGGLEANKNKPKKSSGRQHGKQNQQPRRPRCETNTQDECFIMAIYPAQKYFVLFDVNNSAANGSGLEKSLGLSDDSFSPEIEMAIMNNLSNWLDKITEGLSPNKHAIREWPVFN